jgi:hypothetical protein
VFARLFARAALACGCLALVPATAGAALTIQPDAPGLGFPASATDAVGAVALMSCQDTSGFCIETPAPNQAAPLSVPGNYTPDGEGFYFLADATVPNAGIGLARFALEQAFTTPDPVAGQQIMFGRVRFRFTGLKPGVTYRVTHPYGVSEFAADGTGRINVTDDQGCLGPPCNFQTSTYGQITSFLRWDPTVSPAAPAGYIGNIAVGHKVIGSPVGTNFVRLEELGAGGVVAGVVGETDSFLVQGKLAGAAPAAAAFAIPDTASIDHGARQVGTATPAKTITVANRGTAPMTVSGATVGGADAGDFQVASNTCTTPVAAGSTCAIGVTFTPLATGTRTASLTVASDALNGPHTVALKGTGTPAQAPAPPAQIIQAPAPAPIVIQAPRPIAAGAASSRASRLTALSRVKLRSASRGSGITVRFTAPAGAKVARVRLVKAGTNRSVASKLVDLEQAGAQVIHLRVRGAKAGRYRLEVATGRGALSLTGTVSRTLTLVR